MLRWALNADEAHRLRNAGLGVEAVAAKKGWMAVYVKALLEAGILAE